MFLRFKGLKFPTFPLPLPPGFVPILTGVNIVLNVTGGVPNETPNAQSVQTSKKPTHRPYYSDRIIQNTDPQALGPLGVPPRWPHT